MRPELFDPLTWTNAEGPELTYLREFAAAGSRALIANLTTQVLGVRHADRIFPVTVNHAEYGDSYVCLPHTAYSLYAKAELALVDTGRWAGMLGVLADASGAVLRAASINRIVHLDNWMLSTNLHNGWTGRGIPEIRSLLIDAYPSHILAIRSLNAWSDAPLMARLREDGWDLLPSRQIYVNDDIAKDWAGKRDTKNDLRLLRATKYRIDHMERLGPGDAAQIAKLYALLYLDRYSALNPAYTPAFIQLTHGTGFLRYIGLRDSDEKLVAIAGCLVRGNILTTPVLGYDTGLPREHGLYRLVCVLLTQLAQQSGARLNNSAGAGHFKRLRGAKPVLEYSAYFTRHLALPRRAAVAGLGFLLNRLAVPFIRARGF
jgi:hypothetical protein